MTSMATPALAYYEPLPGPSTTESSGPPVLLIVGAALAATALLVGTAALRRGRRRVQPVPVRTSPGPDQSPRLQDEATVASFVTRDRTEQTTIKRAVETWVPLGVSQLLKTQLGAPIPDLHLLTQWTCSKDPGMEDSNEDVSLFFADSSRAAVFDGATESFAARRWARLVASCWEQDAEDFMGRAQAEYALGASDRALSWAQEEASQRGSFTTIAAIQTAPGGLRTTIVGDSSVLFLNGVEITESFPYVTAEEFGSTPLALGSDAASLRLGVDVLRRSTWLLPVDTSVVTDVLLVTDAVAAWLLVDDPAARVDRVRALRYIDTADQWRDLVHTERAGRRMKTDDSTAILMSIEGRS